jgi:polysaccharide pyruvyl transferase WcaK-like protein
MVAVPSLTANGPLPDHFPPITGERSHFVDDVTKGGSKRAARAVGRFAVAKAMRKPYRPVGLNTATSGRLPPQKAASSQPGVTYIGWLGRQNFGDEAMLSAVQQLLPDATVGYDVADRRLLMLGGGTLINRLTYLEALRRHDSPRLERVVFGTGVADPVYWDLTEPTEGWVDYLDSCSYVGVRGPRSEALLREWGFGGELEILGDPGLSIQPATPTEKEDGLVVISPAWTNGELWGEDDTKVFTAFADLVTEMRRQGREVAYMSCFPGDDRHIMEIMKQSNSLDARYVAAYDDHDGGIEILASAGVVVAERLHAAVVAAACGTPFVAVEYRPKIRDFARSVDQEDYVVRSDEVTSDNLAALITAVEAEGIAARLHPAVDRYRERQRRVAEQLSSLLQN